MNSTRSYHWMRKRTIRSMKKMRSCSMAVRKMKTNS